MNEDTEKLLRETDAGIKMAVGTIKEVLPHIDEKNFKKILLEGLVRHERLQSQVEHALKENGFLEKEPPVMAKAMSAVKTGMTISMGYTDSKAASLITDGCNTGVKSLNKYLNQYSNADKDSTEFTGQLISLEERLVSEIKEYL